MILKQSGRFPVTLIISKMETLSSPDSASDGYSPCSSPTRSNTAIVLPFLLSKARSTSPTCNTRFGSHSPFPSHELSQTNPMPSPSNFEVNGFAGAGSQIHQSTFAAEASTPAEQENRNEMSDDDNDDDAQLEQKPMNFSELSLTSQESQQDENVHTMEDLPLKDWEELQSRYEREMEAAIQHEQSIVNEVEWVMKACVCWVHDSSFADGIYSADDGRIHHRF